MEAALAKLADRWRELCSDLLSPDPGARPRLTDVAWMVRELAHKRRLKLPRRIWLAPLAAACVAAAGLVVVAGVTVASRRQIAKENQTWADDFINVLSVPQRRARFESVDPWVKAAVGHFDRARDRKSPLEFQPALGDQPDRAFPHAQSGG